MVVIRMLRHLVEDLCYVHKHWSLRDLRATWIRFLQHFANCRDILFIDVEFNVIGGDWLSVFTHVFLALIGNMTVNNLDVPGFLIAFRVYITLSVLSSDTKPSNSAQDMCESINVVGCGIALSVCCFRIKNFGVLPKFSTSILKGSYDFTFTIPGLVMQRWLSYVFLSGATSIRLSFFLLRWPRLGTPVEFKHFCALVYLPFRWEVLLLLMKRRRLRGSTTSFSGDGHCSTVAP